MANINISRLKRNNTNKIILHTDNIKLTVNHVNFWLGEIVKSGIEFSILVRDEANFKKLTKQFPKLQICYAKTPVDVETVVNAQPDLKVVLYTSNLARNIHLLRFNHLKHIFIGSKNSDWLSKFNKSYRAYDEFWGGGEFVLERFIEEVKNVGHLKLDAIGKPQLLEILKSSNKLEYSTLILVENREKVLNNFLFVNKSLSIYKKIYLYILNKDKVLKENIKNYIHINSNEDCTFFGNKELLEEFLPKVSSIFTDIENLSPYLLAYRVPIFVYIKNKEEKYKIVPELLQESLYFWSDKEELYSLLEELQKQDALKESRDKITNYIFNTEATLENKFYIALQNSIK